MNIPKLAIKRAIEGGWRPYFEDSSAEDTVHFVLYDRERPSEKEIALDPSFWQSLGKALGWEKQCEFCEAWFEPENPRHCWCDTKPFWIGGHIKRARDFYDLILTGGDTDAYWKELLK